MSTSKLIVCEKSPRWVVALRRALVSDSNILVEIRSLAACGRELAVAPASVLAIEIASQNLGDVLSAWADWTRRYPTARLVILGGPSLGPAESLFREAGACSVVTSIRHVGRIARLALRHIALAPQPPRSLRQSIWQRLPWPRYATLPA